MNHKPTYATWQRRAVCYIVDQYVLVPFVAAWLAPDSIRNYAILAALVFWVWSTMIHQGRTGRSVGRMLTKTRLVCEHTGKPVGFWRTFVRSLVHTLDFIPLCLGFFWPLWDAKRQTWADKIMCTIVFHDALQTSKTAPTPEPEPMHEMRPELSEAA